MTNILVQKYYVKVYEKITEHRFVWPQRRYCEVMALHRCVLKYFSKTYGKLRWELGLFVFTAMFETSHLSAALVCPIFLVFIYGSPYPT